MKIRIQSLSLDVKIPSGQEVELPLVDNAYSLLYLKSAGLFKSQNGLADCRPGNCILIDPSFNASIKAKHDQLIYDCIIFKGSDAARLVQQSCIDTNSILAPLQTYFIDSLFEKVIKEVNSKDLLWERIVSATLDELLCKIHRYAKQDFVLSMPDHAQKLRDLRTEVHESFSKPWTIGQMADIMGLSPSRFASLYKKEFNTSPTEDLIRTRIDQAKKMLSTTKVSVKKVSVACGFESVHYFHRAFKKRNNITPKHYQNEKLSTKGSIPDFEKTFSLDSLSTKSDFIGTVNISDGEVFLDSSDSGWSIFLGYKEDTPKRPLLNLIAPTHLDVGQETIKNIIEGRNIEEVSLDLINTNGDILNIEFSVLLKGKTCFWFARALNALAN